MIYEKHRGEIRMKRPGDKYRKKRDRVLILYLLTVLCAFLLAVATVEVEWL